MQWDFAERFRQARLYAIIDTTYLAGRNVVFYAKEMVEGGADVIQLRAKNETQAQVREMAKEIHAITREARVPFILNDYVTLAAELGVEGVHVGQEDMPVEKVRQLMPAALVGKSTHSLEQALSAQKEKPDSIGFGTLFATQTKPTYLPIGLDSIATVHQKVSLPIFCIGGITINRLDSILAKGAKRVVIVSEWMKSEKPSDYGLNIKNYLNQHPL